MNIWFMIWVFVAVFILGTSVWSFYILLKQKRSWRDFAQKHSLEFSPSAIFKSPFMRGFYNGLPVTVFSDRQLAGGEREKGVRTIFQIDLKAPMPTEGAIASVAFRNFVGGLSLPMEYSPEFDGWNKANIFIRVVKVDAIIPYLTKERLTAFNALMVIKNSPAMLLFSDEGTVLRIESADPFDNPEKLERFLTKLTDAAKIISL